MKIRNYIRVALILEKDFKHRVSCVQHSGKYCITYIRVRK